MIGITGGEPHAVISPTGTRVLYASDWSGAQDGHSIDCYVVELPINVSFVNSLIEESSINHTIYPNPSDNIAVVEFDNKNNLSFSYSLFNFQGQLVANEIEQNSSSFSINKDDLPEGVYFYSLIFSDGSFLNGKIIFN
jgi:hypothetical protein|tara:strand:- start:56 stop:469 length:414 start_codon:yes stop_codon:yes gene_type:complete